MKKGFDGENLCPLFFFMSYYYYFDNQLYNFFYSLGQTWKSETYVSATLMVSAALVRSVKLLSLCATSLCVEKPCAKARCVRPYICKKFRSVESTIFEPRITSISRHRVGCAAALCVMAS